ncbi:alpha/beta-hydrolase [Dendrothele bispora CBS 962.96]|uniref:Alpha/beta-hydrolase n=1 Tax=Dendrothele bispora (strain CBS 962.96) TaxID=1314807 RepID=A0A4S8M3K9_DENBC|nr:alpha/beta-hydrolase [Dendrothele bispora CBS 962.96]
MNDDSVWLPIHPPPEVPGLPKPDLPSPQRKPFWEALPSHPPYTLSTHIVPAALLRSTPEIELPSPPHATVVKETREKRVQEGVRKLWELRREDTERRKHVKEQPVFERRMWICLNRYVRKDLDSRTGRGGRKGLTLCYAHANGFNKETWEPTIYHLLCSPAGQDIDEIWGWEAIQHGDSGLLNRGKLKSLFHWFDGTRDLLNFLIYFMPSTAATTLPVHLPRVPPEESARRLRDGFTERTLIGVGHSIGGCLTARACLAYPQFYSALILIDPVIIPLFEPILREVLNGLALGAFGRRASWSSRKEAFDSLSRSQSFRVWHPDVLKLFVECGTFYDPATSEYKLKLDVVNEATVFTDTITGCGDMWNRMHEIDEKVEIRWIMPGDYDGLVNRKCTLKRVGLRPANSSHVTIPGCGHLVTQEKPKELGIEIGNFISKYSRKKAML